MRSKAQTSQTGISRVCSFCGQQSVREVFMSQAYGKDEGLLVVENVLTVVCDNCGESYFTGSTVEELERILSNQGKIARTRPVHVAQFDVAA